MILTLKLMLSPVIIAVITIAGRRWGSSVSGWLLGFPLTSAPISLIMALQNGAGFAASSAAGNLGGQAAVCVFCLVYGVAALRFDWRISAAFSIAAYFMAVAALNQFPLNLATAFIILLSVVVLTFFLLPKSGGEQKTALLPVWDLPLRMLLTAIFVFSLTGLAETLGPQLSGLIAPFPVFGLITSIFTHRQNGSAAALALFRSYITASAGYACFFLIVGGGLTTLGIGLTYLLATLAILILNGLILLILNKHPGQSSFNPSSSQTGRNRQG